MDYVSDEIRMHFLMRAYFSASSASSSAMTSAKELEAASAGYLLTPAETRRRDDLTSAFSIAALILMCSNVKQRLVLVSALFH